MPFIPVGPVERTKLTNVRLRAIVRCFRRVPRFNHAAAAAGVSAQTLIAWRHRGRIELDFLDEDQADAIHVLRDPETAPQGRPASWREIEAQLQIEISLFLRLVIELAEAERENVDELFGIVMAAARGRYQFVEREDGTMENRVLQPPAWSAATWILERAHGFTRPSSSATAEEAGVDPDEGYAALRDQLDAVSGDREH